MVERQGQKKKGGKEREEFTFTKGAKDLLDGLTQVGEIVLKEFHL